MLGMTPSTLKPQRVSALTSKDLAEQNKCLLLYIDIMHIAAFLSSTPVTVFTDNSIHNEPRFSVVQDHKGITKSILLKVLLKVLIETCLKKNKNKSMKVY